MNTCRAHSKRTGKPCRLPAEPGRELCRFHGGRTPRGMDAPTFRHGRYSKAFQAERAERFAAIQADPDLLSTRAEIAALTVRLEALIERAEESQRDAQGDKAWGQIIRTSEALAALRTAELRRLEKLQAFMTLEQGLALARLLSASVRDRVASGLTGQALIDAIHADIAAAYPVGVGGAAGGALPDGGPRG